MMEEAAGWLDPECDVPCRVWVTRMSSFGSWTRVGGDSYVGVVCTYVRKPQQAGVKKAAEHILDGKVRSRTVPRKRSAAKNKFERVLWLVT